MLSNDNILSNYYLMRVITESDSLNSEEWEKISKKLDFQLDDNSNLIVCLVVVDNKNYAEDEYYESMDKIYLYAMENIIAELFSKKYKCYCVYMKNEVVAIVERLNDGEIQDDFNNIFAITQKVMKQQFDMNISGYIGEGFVGKKNIMREYKKVSSLIKYSYIFGYETVVTTKAISDIDIVVNYDELIKWEKKLVEAIKEGDIEKSKEILDIVFVEIVKGQCYQIRKNVIASTFIRLKFVYQI